jgi:hypothetical protein
MLICLRLKSKSADISASAFIKSDFYPKQLHFLPD